MNQPEWGIMVGLGALSASITDAPGPLVHKRNGMLACCGVIFVTALLTGYARLNPWTLGLEIGVLSFIYALFNVYGARAAAVGSAGMLVMILLMERPSAPAAFWQVPTLILAGGLWYTAISLTFRQFRPYRQAQQALAECVHEIAEFLRIKADFYDGRTNLDDDYRRLVTQHVRVSERQDVVRELLFKSRRMVEETTTEGRALLLTFADVVDLYEHISAMYYDYQSLRNRFGQTGLLSEIALLIRQQVDVLDRVGLALGENRTDVTPIDLGNELHQLRTRIDALPPDGQQGNPLILKRILVNLRQLGERINGLRREPANEQHPTQTPAPVSFDYTRFVTHQPIRLSQLRDNLSLSSTTFRYALRMTIACLVGYLIASFWSSGQHSYWILLTITVILKPAFALTRQRNRDRLMGTLAGGLLGVVLLLTVTNTTALFGLMVLFMLGTYSFLRLNYVTMVFCVTPFVLILLNFMGVGLREVVEERVLDTILGGLIALAASYGLFPRWESEQVVKYLNDVLQADMAYLQTLTDMLAGKPVSITDYKLSRKNVYVQSANLSAAFERMLSEPRNKQTHREELLRFAVLNHIFASNIATIVTGVMNDETPRDEPFHAEQLQFIQKLIADMTRIVANIQER